MCRTSSTKRSATDLGTAFRDLGIQRVKNISRPVRVWQWSPDTDRAEIEPDELALQRLFGS